MNKNNDNIDYKEKYLKLKKVLPDLMGKMTQKAPEIKKECAQVISMLG